MICLGKGQLAIKTNDLFGPMKGFIQPTQTLGKNSETKAPRAGFIKFFIEMD